MVKQSKKTQKEVVETPKAKVGAISKKKKKAPLAPAAKRDSDDKAVKLLKNEADTLAKPKKTSGRKVKAEKNGKASTPDTPDTAEKALKCKKSLEKNGTVLEVESTVVKEKDLKRKKKADKNGIAPMEEDSENVPQKKAKGDANVITAGTTIDQVPGIKLKKKKNKHEKHAKFMKERSEKARNKERDEALQYLEAWKNTREQWKFEKLKQIYIQTHIFEEDKFDANVFPLALEYLSGMRGSSKDSLQKTAETIIQEIDAKVIENGDDSAQAGSKYQRARELLQTLV